MLRGMPIGVAGILTKELMNYVRCDGCDEIAICEKRDDYIADIADERRDYVYYVPFAGSYGYQPKKYEMVFTKADNLCHDCLAFFNDNWLDELERYSDGKRRPD